jgi:hypothetical protein
MWKKIPPLKQKEARTMDRALHKKTRFLVDENIGKLASILRELGLHARSAHEAGLKGHSDEDLFALGWKRQWVIITNDKDFLNDRRYPFHRCPGVLILPSPARLGWLCRRFSKRPSSSGSLCRGLSWSEDGYWIRWHGDRRGFSQHRDLHWKVRFKVDEHDRLWEWDAL